jgi:multidrug efflux pump subunit AcrB
MERIIKNLTEIDRYGDQKFKFSRLDKFGTMLQFHIQGSYTYQTKVGSLFTLLFYFLVAFAFLYYGMKFADTSQPLVIMSDYTEKDDLSHDIIKDRHIPYFQAIK